MLDIYGDLDHVSIITIAPELNPDNSVIEECSKRGITVSIGHSGATLKQAESAVRSGARKVTHLFNAMTVFHHRADPGKVWCKKKTVKIRGKTVVSFCSNFQEKINSNSSLIPESLRKMKQLII